MSAQVVDSFFSWLVERWQGVILLALIAFVLALMVTSLTNIYTALTISQKLDVWLGQTLENTAHIKILYDKTARLARRIK